MAGQVRDKNAEPLLGEPFGEVGHDAFVRGDAVEKDDVAAWLSIYGLDDVR
jgi:hypothetical protein